MGHQVIKLQNPLKTLGFLQFYRFKTVKDRIIAQERGFFNINFSDIFYLLCWQMKSMEEIILASISRLRK